MGRALNSVGDGLYELDYYMFVTCGLLFQVK